MKAQSSFTDRVARIEKGKTFGGMAAVEGGNLVQGKKRKRVIHWDMLVVGALAGGVAGTLFAWNVGLLFVVTLNLETLYQLVLADYMTASFIAGVAIAPVGFVLSQIFSRSNPRGWQFWIGYLSGVLAANYSDLQTYYYVLTAPPV